MLRPLLNKPSFVIGWFLITCPRSNSNISRPRYNSTVVCAPDTPARDQCMSKNGVLTSAWWREVNLTLPIQIPWWNPGLKGNDFLYCQPKKFRVKLKENISVPVGGAFYYRKKSWFSRIYSVLFFGWKKRTLKYHPAHLRQPSVSENHEK